MYKAAIFISLYKSQHSTYHILRTIHEILHHFLLTIWYLYTGIGNLNDYSLNVIATTANPLSSHKEHITLESVTTWYQQQIFQPKRKAILFLFLILNM